MEEVAIYALALSEIACLPLGTLENYNLCNLVSRGDKRP